MIELRQGQKYIDEFHKNCPDTDIIKSRPFKALPEMREMVKWSKENLTGNVLVTIHPVSDQENSYFLKWFCEDETDAMAVKIKWG